MMVGRLLLLLLTTIIVISPSPSSLCFANAATIYGFYELEQHTIAASLAYNSSITLLSSGARTTTLAVERALVAAGNDYNNSILVGPNQPVTQWFGDNNDLFMYSYGRLNGLMTPSYSDEASTLLNIANMFSWRHVAVIYDLEHSADGFLDALSSSSLVTVTMYRAIHSDDVAFQALDDVSASGYRVVILHCSPAYARLLLVAARGRQHMWLGTSAWIPALTTMASNDNEAALADGMVGVIGTTLVASDTFRDTVWLPRSEAIDSLTPYVYETMLALRTATELAGNTAVSSVNDELRNLQYNGVTGVVRFYNDTSLLRRIPVLEVVNYRPTRHLQVIGRTFNNYNNDDVTIKSGWIFPDGSPYPPVEQFTFTLDFTGTVLWVTVITVAISALSSFCVSLLLFTHRAEPYIRAIAPSLMQIIIVGTIVSYLGVVVWVVAESAFFSCHAPALFWSIAFDCTLCTLMFKSYRIHRIFFGKLKIRDMMKDQQIMMAVAGFVIYDICFWCLLYAGAPARRESQLLLSPNGYAVVCVWPALWAPMVFQVAPKCCMLLIALWLSVRVRHVPHNFNESKPVALSIFLQIVAVGLVATVYLATRVTAIDAAHLVVVVGVCVSMQLLLGTLLVPRLWTVRRKRVRLRKTSLFIHHSSPTHADMVSYSRRNVRCLNCGTPTNPDYIRTLLATVAESPRNTLLLAPPQRRQPTKGRGDDGGGDKGDADNNDIEYNRTNSPDDMIEEEVSDVRQTRPLMQQQMINGGGSGGNGDNGGNGGSGRTIVIGRPSDYDDDDDDDDNDDGLELRDVIVT